MGRLPGVEGRVRPLAAQRGTGTARRRRGRHHGLLRAGPDPDDRTHAHAGPAPRLVCRTRPRTRSPKRSSSGRAATNRPGCCRPSWPRCCWPGPPIARPGCGTGGSSPIPVPLRADDDRRERGRHRGPGAAAVRAARSAFAARGAAAASARRAGAARTPTPCWRSTAARWPDRAAIVDDDGVWDYRQLRSATESLARRAVRRRRRARPSGGRHVPQRTRFRRGGLRRRPGGRRRRPGQYGLPHRRAGCRDERPPDHHDGRRRRIRRARPDR